LVVWAILVCLSAVLLPGAPNEPEAPVVPGEHVLLGAPSEPEAPVVPDEHVLPGALNEPEALVVLGEHVLPGAPNEPEAPGVPAPPEDQFTAFREARMSLPVKCEPAILVAVGDIMLSRGVADRISEHGDTGLPFAKVKGLLKAGDIVFGNLECPLTPGRAIDIREMVLRADPEMADALAGAGFTLLSLANNHMGDFGPSGVLDTLGYLDEAGISWVGAGPDARSAYAPRMVEVRGLRFAFLAFTDPEIAPPSYQAGEDTPGTASFSTVRAAQTTHADHTTSTGHSAHATEQERAEMLAAIRDARLAADFVVVSLHAGTEYAEEPDAFQVESARAAIDAGADLVIGHHPHVAQRVERYRDRYILYSLGNFVFDQWWSRETRQGVIARITIGQEGVERIEFVPVLINRDAQPEVLKGLEASEVLSRLDLNLSELAVGSLYDPDPEDVTSARYAYLDLATGGAALSRLVKERSFDLDQDGVVERVALRDGRLTVETASTLIWETPETWWVDDFALGDANNDGVVDVSLSVWKSGSFGPCRPFWVAEDDPSVRNHLFIFKLVDGAMKPVWQSSNLDSPNYELEVVDLDGDGRTELLVLEGDYDNLQFRQMSIWKWNDWGFFRVSEPLHCTLD